MSSDGLGVHHLAITGTDMCLLFGETRVEI